MPLKVLDPEAEGGFAKKLKRLISANRAYFLLVGTAHYLGNLEKAGEAGHPFLMPVVDYSLITYAAIFNSGNPSNDGVGRYNVGEVFPSGPSRSLHEIIMSYRNKEIAHLTDFTKKTFILTSAEFREITIQGHHERDHFCNFCQPGQPFWKEYLNHIAATRDWFKSEYNRLREEITKTLKGKPLTYFEGLSDGPALPPVVDHLIEIYENLYRDMLQTQGEITQSDDISPAQ